MKILELGKFYPPCRGGMETLLRTWSEGFARLGAEVDCVVANTSASTVHEEINGVHVHRLASFGQLLSTSICPAYLTSAKRYSADVWHAHFPNPLADLACLSGDAHTPLVIHYHSDIVRQSGALKAYGRVVHRLLKRAKAIVVATPLHIEYSDWLKSYRDKCEIIPFGIDLERFASNGRTAQVESLRASSLGRPILLTIGRLVGYKGHTHLIKAAQQVDAVVWVVGTGPLEASLREQCRQDRVADRVQFWGSVPDRDLPAFLHACDVFVLPSVSPNEAFGLVQIEAMACGKPVVSCSLKSGVPFVNLDGITGLIVPPADSKALALALNRLVNDPALRTQLGESGLGRARSEFDEKVMIARYWDCLLRVVSS
jgi:rhamnosyl/mannosyltransferase